MRSRTRAAIEQLGLIPFEKMIAGREPPIGEYENNWCAVMSGNFGTAAAILAEEMPRAAQLLPVATGEAEGILDAMGPDLEWEEGISYWGYALEAVLRYADVAADLGLPDQRLWEHESLQSWPAFPGYLWLSPGQYAMIGDAGSLWYVQPVLHRLAREHTDGRLQWLGDATKASPRWTDILWRDRGLESVRPHDLPLAHLFRKLQWAVMRTGWDENAVVLVFRSGTKGPHSHLDINHFVLQGYGDTLLWDMGGKGRPATYFAEGGKTHAYWSDTKSHSTIVMDEGSQQVDLGRGGEITRFLHGPHCDYIRSDGTRAYPDKASGVVRHVLFVRPSYFLIVDDLAAEWKTLWDWYGQSRYTFAVDGVEITARGAAARLWMRVLEPPGATATPGEHPGGEKFVRIRADGTPSSCRFVVLCYPLPKARRREPLEMPTCDLQATADGSVLTVHRVDGLTDLISWGPVHASAGDTAFAVTTCGDNAKVTGFSSFRMARLQFAGRALLKAPDDVCVSASLSANSFEAAIAAPVAGEATLACPGRPQSVLIDGRPAKWRYHPGARLLALQYPEGTHWMEATLP